jgi:signal transduction histidine kinase
MTAQPLTQADPSADPFTVAPTHWEQAKLLHLLLDGQEVERQRLAQELHDGPLQELHSLDFGLVALSRQLDNGEQAQISEMRVVLQNISRRLRALCQDLRPPALTPFGLSVVLQSYAELIQQQAPDLQIELQLVDDGQQLPERVRLVLYRIYQQTLLNVVRHAAAQRVVIRFAIEPSEVSLTIEDDGCGFALPPSLFAWIAQGRYGLIGCIERAEAIGGHIRIHSTVGQGTTITTRLPLLGGTAEIR